MTEKKHRRGKKKQKSENIEIPQNQPDELPAEMDVKDLVDEENQQAFFGRVPEDLRAYFESIEPMMAGEGMDDEGNNCIFKDHFPG
jgi:hypothetical protein